MTGVARRGSQTTMNAGDPCGCCAKRQLLNIRKRSFTGSARGSELPIVYRLHLKDNITLGEGRGNTFIMLPKERRKGDCGNAINSRCSGISGVSYTGRPSESERLWKKMIGKPCAGKPPARFDEGELEIAPFRLLRQLSTLLKPRSRSPLIPSHLPQKIMRGSG